MEPLTKRQKEILDFIKEFIAEHGYAPSYREIANYFEFSSVATVAEHIYSLKNKGYLDCEENMARSIQLNPLFEPESFTVPLLGTIAAGKPIEAIRTQETIEIPRDMAGKNVFALKVRGDSMEKDGILEGDYVIIEKIDNPKDGDIVVALIDNDSATLKRYYKEKDCVRLEPRNPNYKPIRTKKVIIQGRVKGVIRKFV
jgi:repressor LexA